MNARAEEAAATGAPAEVRRFELRADHQAAMAARRAVESATAGLDPSLASDVRLLTSEVVTNSVRHAFPDAGQTINLEIALSARAVRITVADGGMGFEPPGPRPLGELRPAGWGLQLIDVLAKRWGVESDRGLTVWFELDLPSAATGSAPGVPPPPG